MIQPALHETFPQLADYRLMDQPEKHPDPMVRKVMAVWKKNVSFAYSGDQVIRAVAQAVLSSSRDIDAVGRYGGDEFAVVLPETGPRGAVGFMARCRWCGAGS